MAIIQSNATICLVHREEIQFQMSFVSSSPRRRLISKTRNAVGHFPRFIAERRRENATESGNKLPDNRGDKMESNGGYSFGLSCVDEATLKLDLNRINLSGFGGTPS